MKALGSKAKRKKTRKPSPSSVEKERAYEALRYENEKLKIINRVLMQRVELGWGNHSDAYLSFERAALLSDKVKERALQLKQTLNRLEESNEFLAAARTESEQARQLLLDAIEIIPESFALFDADRKLMLSNSRFWNFCDFEPLAMEASVTTLSDVRKMAARLGVVDSESKKSKQSSHNSEGLPEMVFRLKNGRWIKMTERSTADGCLIVVYADWQGPSFLDSCQLS